MSQIFQRYFSKIDWTKIFDDLISKCISLIFIFLLFFIAKKAIHSLVKRILTPSFKYTVQDEARKKTILRLVESLLNYCLYFILIYWILSILGLQSLVYWLVLGLLGWLSGWEPRASFPIWSMVSSSF